MKRTCVLLALPLFFALAPAARAQRPRTVGETQQPAATPTPPPAPQSVKAKYEGGYTGYMKKQTGTLLFDDASRRLVFRDKYQREYFSLPYGALAAIWGDTHAVRPTAARVVGAVPLPYGVNMLSLLARQKLRYLVVEYADPDTKVQGGTSFKLENKEMLASVLNTLAQKAELVPRGEAFIRPPKDADKDKDKDK